jgi:taurine dioxygenase
MASGMRSSRSCILSSKYSPRELRPLSEASAQVLPPPGIHPLVRTHPESRRKALYLNPVRIESIVGMADDEGLELVAELMAHATQPKMNTGTSGSGATW